MAIITIIIIPVILSANLGQRVVGVFTNTWDDITSSLRQTVVNATRDVTRSATESVLGISADTVIRTFNDSLVNITTGAIQSVRGGALDVPLQLQNISELSWGQAILTVTASGGPYDPWLSLLCQVRVLGCVCMLSHFVVHSRRFSSFSSSSRGWQWLLSSTKAVEFSHKYADIIIFSV